MAFKFKIKSFKEIQEDWKKNWEKFKEGINELFGAPTKATPKKKSSETIKRISEPQAEAGDGMENKKLNAIDVTAEEIDTEIIGPIEPEEGAESEEYGIEKGGSKGYEIVASSRTQGETGPKPLEENWKRFSKKVLESFEDMKNKIEKWNKKNAEKWEEMIKIGRANYKIWLKKQEIKRANRKEQQRLAIERFKKWVKEQEEKNKRFFAEQSERWKKQLEKWRKEIEEMPDRWAEQREKMRKEYEEWIKRRREYAIEKAKWRLQVGWRTNLYIMMGLLPVIIVAIIIVAVFNAITGR